MSERPRRTWRIVYARQGSGNGSWESCPQPSDTNLLLYIGGGGGTEREVVDTDSAEADRRGGRLGLCRSICLMNICGLVI